MITVLLQPLRRAARWARGRGFTLLELIAAVMIAGLLAAIALPSYSAIIERQKVTRAGRDLQQISMAIERYRSLRFTIPQNLGELGIEIPKDPWGRDYQFLNFEAPIPGIKGKIRKDHNLHPLNTQYDLYSFGKDGQSKSPLTAKASRDDVIWARDGGFVGLAEDF